ncbi:hypothetical protein GCM10027185_31220 [Spirosoma pulveris]
MCAVVEIDIGKRHRLTSAGITDVASEGSCALSQYAGYSTSYQDSNQAKQNKHTSHLGMD